MATDRGNALTRPEEREWKVSLVVGLIAPEREDAQAVADEMLSQVLDHAESVTAEMWVEEANHDV